MDHVISHVCQWCVPTIMCVGAPSTETLHIQAELSVRPSAEQGHSHIEAEQMVRTLSHTHSQHTHLQKCAFPYVLSCDRSCQKICKRSCRKSHTICQNADSRTCYHRTDPVRKSVKDPAETVTHLPKCEFPYTLSYDTSCQTICKTSCRKSQKCALQWAV
jgi:hypothetical protein